MSTLFSSLADSTKGMEAAKDSLGGFRARESDLYDAILKVAYVGQSAGGANFMELVFTLADGTDYKERQFFTSGKDKGQKPYYEKGDKKLPLPGYTIVSDLLRITAGTTLETTEFEEKQVNVYDADQKKDLPKAVMVPVEALGKKVTLGIQKVLEIKQKKNEATGEYEDTDETREINQIDKLFDTDSGLTVVEALTAHQAGNDKPEPVFRDEWLKANQGKTRDNTKKGGAKGNAGAKEAPKAAGATGGAPAVKKSLFG
ncbi:hypothetical protein Axy10_053 [Achromobacter phage vB_AxyP_19-32_Axy10]|uniref:SsDNA-binding protein n=1 Tax=Achromobacter phage vB_AxyP_19-32_Axy10 TaxID=2591041 RepID=A0A514CTY5_9CAUD|nr:single strand DNA binding protein [Achromobacter phage vB_AxyP_19-32_Axy10]QDH83937.1 hypothetical protein Axy10_053 [Achromobacter phage vB_AxyP_19-32_Axy10]